jgi:hypothetical protein
VNELDDKKPLHIAFSRDRLLIAPMTDMFYSACATFPAALGTRLRPALLIVIGSGGLLLGGCAENNLYKERQDILNSWVGKPEQTLIENQGIPDREKTLNGLMYSQYDRRCFFPPLAQETVVAISMATVADSANAAAGRRTHQANDLWEEATAPVCDRWLFRLKDGVIDKSISGGQFADASTLPVPAAVPTGALIDPALQHACQTIAKGTLVHLDLKDGRHVAGKLERCDASVAIRSALILRTFEMPDVQSLTPDTK